MGRMRTTSNRFATERAQSLERALRRMVRKDQRLKPIGHWLLGKRYQAHLEIAEFRAKLGAKVAGNGSSERSGPANPQNLVWIFGMGRSGNTWMMGMMREMSHQQTWDEPFVGKLFGDFYNKETVANLTRANFIMGDPVRKSWIRSIRSFVLNGAISSHPRLRPEDYLIVGEHNGSAGAPLLVEALPESRVILLVRDPRDVVASIVDGARKGGWLHQWRESKGIWQQDSLVERDPNAYVKQLAERYSYEVGCAKRAYDAHKGRKILVRYEDLRANTLSTMRRIYSALEIPVNEEELVQVVAAHSWENIPMKDKGQGKFTRKATPGAWREDLTPEQAKIIEETTSSLLEAYYAL
jgi:hypothetical protein